MNVHTVKIECDEDGFHLILETDAPYPWHRQDFRLEDPEALYNTCRAEIGPWLYEREQALATYRTDPASPGFAGVEETIADVGHKHPDWYSVHVDHYDNRDKTAGA